MIVLFISLNGCSEKYISADAMPPHSPGRLTAETGDGFVTLYWQLNPDFMVDFLLLKNYFEA